ncbi:MAG: phosphoribosyl-ATP diphosphatase [Pseudomonadota bacterium]
MTDATILDELYRVVASRKGGDPEVSYTASLFAKGTPKIAQKLGEEAVETVIEAMSGDSTSLASESADLLYHLMVVWAQAGLEPEDVWNELASRHGQSGLVEKANRKS